MGPKRSIFLISHVCAEVILFTNHEIIHLQKSIEDKYCERY